MLILAHHRYLYDTEISGRELPDLHSQSKTLMLLTTVLTCPHRLLRKNVNLHYM